MQHSQRCEEKSETTYARMAQCSYLSDRTDIASTVFKVSKSLAPWAMHYAKGLATFASQPFHNLSKGYSESLFLKQGMRVSVRSA